MSAFGFGFIEIGTVTPKPQEGNPKTRIFRLIKDEALINRLGFNNDGVEKVIKRLKNNKKVIIGGNIGKNKDTPNENAEDDYLFCFKKLYDYVDYFTVNVSSPNTPNLRDLQNIQSLRSILIPLIEENKKRSSKPILLKISPDLADEDIISVVDLIQDINLDGIISTNTTIKRNKLKSLSNLKNEKGGLSGTPLKNRSTEVISLIHKYSKGKVPIIGVGGIMSPKDAIEKLNAGASLIQVYTGFIYNGPSFAYKINREIIKSLN
jgi:dihydroorotate dehydrogenase